MNTQISPKICIYCGNKVRNVKKGEHIIPKAIGGGLTTDKVCQDCNNQFSQIDKELCSRSPLSIIASQEIDAHIWQTWDVDLSSHNLLLEGIPNWAAKSFVLYPQIIFEQNGPQIRCDFDELRQFGHEDYERVLVKSMLKSYRCHESGEKRWLHFEHIESNANILHKYRFPPRIFWRHTIGELAKRLRKGKKTSLIMRYLTEADRRFALNVLDNWNLNGEFRKQEEAIGSYFPEIRCFFELNMTLRALAKMAINILAEFCPNTPVNKNHFGDVIKIIVGDHPVTANLLKMNGFVYPSDIESIKCPNGGHSFRLLYMDKQWHVYSSFFGGRIGTFIKFPGPNNEDWRSADICAPLKSKNWSKTTSNILQPFTVRHGWQDLKKIIPSAEMINLKSELHTYTTNRDKRGKSNY